MQSKNMTKQELHKMIDELPEDEVMVLTYKKNSGISDNGKMINKRKIQILVNKANVIILIDTKPVRQVNLEENFRKFPSINKESIIKSILLPRTE